MVGELTENLRLLKKNLPLDGNKIKIMALAYPFKIDCSQPDLINLTNLHDESLDGVTFTNVEQTAYTDANYTGQARKQLTTGEYVNGNYVEYVYRHEFVPESIELSIMNDPNTTLPTEVMVLARSAKYDSLHNGYIHEKSQFYSVVVPRTTVDFKAKNDDHQRRYTVVRIQNDIVENSVPHNHYVILFTKVGDPQKDMHLNELYIYKLNTFENTKFQELNYLVVMQQHQLANLEAKINTQYRTLEDLHKTQADSRNHGVVNIVFGVILIIIAGWTLYSVRTGSRDHRSKKNLE